MHGSKNLESALKREMKKTNNNFRTFHAFISLGMFIKFFHNAEKFTTTV